MVIIPLRFISQTQKTCGLWVCGCVLYQEPPMVSKYKSKSGKDIFFMAEPASFPAPSRCTWRWSSKFEIWTMPPRPLPRARASFATWSLLGGFLATLRLQLPCGERRGAWRELGLIYIYNANTGLINPPPEGRGGTFWLVFLTTP